MSEERPGRRMKFQGLPALYMALSRLTQEDMDCEAPGHGQDHTRHDDGPGMWYVVYKCPVCSETKCDLICTAYLKYVTLNNAVFKCSCGVLTDYRSYKSTVTRRKGLK